MAHEQIHTDDVRREEIEREAREPAGACPTLPIMARQRSWARCEAAGLEKPEVYSLEYSEDFFRPRTTQMAADHSPQ